MMHCTMDDLLALQAGEASVWARKHLEECAACRAELESVYQRVAQLKALPALRPPRDRWPAVRNVVIAGRQRRRARWRGWGLAAAAAVAGLIVFRPFGGGSTLHAELTQAKQQSATLESTLSAADPDGRVVSGQEAALAAQLEDRIALVDGKLTRIDRRGPDAELVDLWKQRVNLMQQLVQVRVTRASYVGL
jgi:hypothetical protein